MWIWEKCKPLQELGSNLVFVFFNWGSREALGLCTCSLSSNNFVHYTNDPNQTLDVQIPMRRNLQLLTYKDANRNSRIKNKCFKSLSKSGRTENVLSGRVAQMIWDKITTPSLSLASISYRFHFRALLKFIELQIKEECNIRGSPRTSFFPDSRMCRFWGALCYFLSFSAKKSTPRGT